MVRDGDFIKISASKKRIIYVPISDMRAYLYGLSVNISVCVREKKGIHYVGSYVRDGDYIHFMDMIGLIETVHIQDILEIIEF